ncbi:ATP synthase F1 subunit gamma [Desulfuromonas carbonis]|uniref:ATP synthase F1 subunit gamma n=1 Tax=Desulfuromonas sp. DDH964 TaxID=1823759 RepID=UPI00078E798F|nr:ATP synthase F1 subunit gamma [Desulfuromonas sp. DDH964]AMV73962.1 F0F1 ATP synthase subunit gamma [Desulfuromonas sp. DDH964]
MANLKDIKKRITSVKNTRQITKAMKMVSAAKLRRAQEAVVAARPYAKKMQDVLSSLAMREDADGHPLLMERGKGRALVLLLTADRGLCGGFNGNVSKAAERFIKSNEAGYEGYDLVIVGRKGREYLKSRAGLTITKVHENLTGSISYSTAALIGQEIIDQYVAGSYDAVFFVFNAFRSAISQDVTIDQLLPIVPKVVEANEQVVDYIYEPSRGEVLDQILPKHIEVQIFRGLLESVASEHGARMSAMDSASKNASEMIGKLTLQYNRARQAAITKELMEIISGAESIK